MGEDNHADEGASSAGKWTIMVYLASDDANSPLFVEQVKAMKDAGYHENVEILVYFDPHEPGVRTSILNVNKKQKEAAIAKRLQEKANEPVFQIGDDRDSYVLDVAEDLLDVLPENMASVINDQANATESFEAFLKYGLTTKADHYVLVVVGHGMIVANDAFLPDQNPRSGISLKVLAEKLGQYFGPSKANLELLALHSCAMAGVEVAYQLKDTAKYMIASEGLAFVMGWQYRQLLKRLFKGVVRGDGVERIIESIYWLSNFSTRDFLLAGYPLELTLCNLNGDKAKSLMEKIGDLVQRMREGLAAPDEEAMDAIQLAHLKSQSYFGEAYTDLYDFCECLREKCKTDRLKLIRAACEEVIKVLKPAKFEENETPKRMKRFDRLVIHSNYFGWSSQYSHGLSVFFPWAEPLGKSENPTKTAEGETRKGIMEVYGEYALNQDLKEYSWSNFLKDYFAKTRRQTRVKEDLILDNPNPLLRHQVSSATFDSTNVPGSAAIWAHIGGLEKPTGGSEKPTGGSSDCDCPWIKNYPRNWWSV